MTFILPHCVLPLIFVSPLNVSQLILKAAVIFGFFGMFRQHTYVRLGFANLFVVGRLGKVFKLRCGSYHEVYYYVIKKRCLGFYFVFPDKYHSKVHAYVSRLMDMGKPWSDMCPVTVLLQLAKNDCLVEKIFPQEFVAVTPLSCYMRCLARVTSHSGIRYSPHSLRMGVIHFIRSMTWLRILWITLPGELYQELVSCITGLVLGIIF